MTSLNTLQVAPLVPIWQRRYYEAVSETLFEMPEGLLIEQQEQFLKTRKQNALVLALLERFIEETIRDPELKKLCDDDGSVFQAPYASKVAKRYFTQIPDFIRIVSKLSDRYEYNEHIQVFNECCATLGLQGLYFWSDLANFHLTGARFRDPEMVYFELARMIRERCLSLSILTAISKRRHDANERFKEYCKYIDACFAKHSRLVFIRLDLYYKKTSLSDEATAERANADLYRMLNNRRHNRLFAGWVGYVVKLEYGVQKGVHWHLLVWFDGRVRDGANHVYLAEQIGKYWIKLTNSNGAYWNCNAKGKEYDRRGQLGIGLIRYSDVKLRDNLMNEVLSYLTKTSQLLRPKVGEDFKTINRGHEPKQLPGEKRGRNRMAFDPAASPLQVVS